MPDFKLNEWQDDGHKLTLGMDLFHSRVGDSPGRSYGQLKLTVDCPADSICHQWHTAHGSLHHHCFVQLEIEAIGAPDFIDSDLDADLLPDNWSSSVNELEIEWRDEGEDGIRWRPKTSST